MDHIIEMSIAAAILCVGVGVMLTANYASKFLKEKANEAFDVARSRKVSAVLDLVEMNIATAITNYLHTKERVKIDESELREAAVEIANSVSKITGVGVIDFIKETFAGDWDEWIVEKVQESIARKAQYEKKQ